MASRAQQERYFGPEGILKRRLQLSRNLQDSPGFVASVPDPGRPYRCPIDCPGSCPDSYVNLWCTLHNLVALAYKLHCKCLWLQRTLRRLQNHHVLVVGHSQLDNYPHVQSSAIERVCTIVELLAIGIQLESPRHENFISTIN